MQHRCLSEEKKEVGGSYGGQEKQAEVDEGRVTAGTSEREGRKGTQKETMEKRRGRMQLYIPSRQGQGGKLRCEPRTIPRMAGGEGAKMALDHMP